MSKPKFQVEPLTEEKLTDLIKPEEPKTQTKDLDVLKELFTYENIETKTELTGNQIIEVNKKRAIASMLQWEELDSVITDFLRLQISLNRQGAKMFIDGFKSNRENQQIQNPNLFSRMGEMFKK